jgi:hypothetical protein
MVGGFMYIGTVGVIPELLVISGNRTKGEEFMDGVKQLIAMFVGIGLMTYSFDLLELTTVSSHGSRREEYRMFRFIRTKHCNK